MNNPYRRYELLIPLRLNDDRAVPHRLVGKTVIEARRQFSALSTETQTIDGVWTHEGRIYRDPLMRVFIDVPDLPEHREFLVEYKEELKERFQQIDIWITTFPLDVV